MNKIANFKHTQDIYLFNNGIPEKHTIDVTWYDNGEKVYTTDADDNAEKRARIISAFESIKF